MMKDPSPRLFNLMGVSFRRRAAGIQKQMPRRSLSLKRRGGGLAGAAANLRFERTGRAAHVSVEIWQWESVICSSRERRKKQSITAEINQAFRHSRGGWLINSS